MLGAERVVVHLVAGDAVLLGDVDRGDAHVDVDVRVTLVVAGQQLVLVVGAGDLAALVEARDELDPGGDVGVALAVLDGVGGVPDRVERGGAVAGDGDAVRLLAQILGEQRP